MKDYFEKREDRETEKIDATGEFSQETSSVIDAEIVKEETYQEEYTLSDEGVYIPDENSSFTGYDYPANEGIPVQQYTFSGGYAPPGYDNSPQVDDPAFISAEENYAVSENFIPQENYNPQRYDIPPENYNPQGDYSPTNNADIAGNVPPAESYGNDYTTAWNNSPEQKEMNPQMDIPPGGDLFEELFGGDNTVDSYTPAQGYSTGYGGAFSAETKTLYYTPEEFNLQMNQSANIGNISSEDFSPNGGDIPSEGLPPNNGNPPPGNFPPNDGNIPPGNFPPNDAYMPPEEPSRPSQAAESANKVKRKIGKRALFIAAGVVVAIILFLVIGSLVYPLDAQKDSANIYIIRGEAAKTTVNFENTSSSDKQLVLDCGDYGESTYTIAGDKVKPVQLNFNTIKTDTQIVAKYGFLNLKKLKINVVVVNPGAVSISTTLTQITDTNGTDLSEKKYCLPNTKVSITAKAMNTSGKPFQRNFDLKINGKVVDTKAAVWGEDSLSTASLTYNYTFTKQGYYKIEIGDSKINFICSTNDEPPSNGKMLKKKISGGMGQLKIENTYNFPVIVTLCKSSDPDKALNRIYIKANKTVTMTGIKDGKYMIYMKGGTGYSKMAKDILDASTAYKSYSPMNFATTSRTYSIWTLKLGVAGGNTNITSIDDNEVPM